MYEPGTRLSYNNGSECATVLTNGMVMITLANDAPWREKMSLDDWLILADGEERVVSLSRAETARIEEDMRRNALEQEEREYARICDAEWCAIGYKAFKAAEKKGSTSDECWREDYKAREFCPIHSTYPQRSLGTKLRWTSEDGHGSRTVIVKKGGFLQVKWTYPSVVRGQDIVDCQKRMFSSEAEWRDSLPAGSVVVQVNTPPKWSCINPEMSDPEKLHHIEKTFKIRNTIVRYASHSERLAVIQSSCEDRQKYLDSVGQMGVDLPLQIMKEDEAEQLALMEGMTPDEKTHVRYSMHNSGFSRAYLQINGSLEEIAYHSTDEGEFIMTANGNHYSHFEDMNPDLDREGRPILRVKYRGRKMNLNYLL